MANAMIRSAIAAILMVVAPASSAQSALDKLQRQVIDSAKKALQGGSPTPQSGQPPQSPAQAGPAGASKASDPDASAEKPADATDSQGSGPDVLGLRIGMTPRPVVSIYKQRGFGANKGPGNAYSQDAASLAIRGTNGQAQAIPNSKFLQYIYGIDAGTRTISQRERPPEHQLVVHFAPLPGRETVVALERNLTYVLHAQPTLEVFQKALIEKYGVPTDAPKDFPFILRWKWDANGVLRKRSPESEKLKFIACQDVNNDPGLGNPSGTSWVLQRLPGWLQAYPDLVAQCGSIFLEVVVNFQDNYAGKDSLIRASKTNLIGFEAALSSLGAARAIMAKAQSAASGAAVQEGRKQKPDL